MAVFVRGQARITRAACYRIEYGRIFNYQSSVCASIQWSAFFAADDMDVIAYHRDRAHLTGTNKVLN